MYKFNLTATVLIFFVVGFKSRIGSYFLYFVADALYRQSLLPPLASPPLPVSANQPLPSALPIDFYELSTMQLYCPDMSSLLSNPSLCVVSVPSGASSVLCE